VGKRWIKPFRWERKLHSSALSVYARGDGGLAHTEQCETRCGDLRWRGVVCLARARRQSSRLRPLTQRAARSYTALPRAAHYPLSLPPYCKAFMAFLGFWRSASLRSDIFLLNWSPAQRCQRSTTPPVEAFFWEPTTGAIVLVSEGPLPSRPEPICRSNTPGIPVWSGFRPDRFLVYFVLRETFWD